MIGNYLEAAIVGFIVVTMAFFIWRGGAANPEGTGSLGRRVTAMKSEMQHLKSSVDAIKSEVTSIDSRVAEIDRRGATSEDIRGIERKLEEQGRCLAELDDGQTNIREMAASRGATLDEIRAQVGRLYDVLVPRGLNK